MLDASQSEEIKTGIRNGTVVPYLGPEALGGVVEQGSGQPIPADSDSLILSLNGGRPMAPRLMYEFPRAAMNLELKRGRGYVEHWLTETYAQKQWTQSAFHQWLAAQNVPYLIDTNRDQLMQNAYADRKHTLIVGLARVAGTDYRFKIFEFTGTSYEERWPATVDPDLPVLFKPLGTPAPEPNYIASDADFVDYITELMGGFAIPSFVKERRTGKRYFVAGLRLRRDTERMILTELMYGADSDAGWVFIEQPTTKERRFCEKRGLTLIEAPASSLLG